MRPYWIYLIGIVILGLCQEEVRATLNSGFLNFIAFIAYVLALRFVARKFGKAKD